MDSLISTHEVLNHCIPINKMKVVKEFALLVVHSKIACKVLLIWNSIFNF